MDKNEKYYLVEFSNDFWIVIDSFFTFNQALTCLNYLRAKHEDSFFRVVQVFDC